MNQLIGLALFAGLATAATGAAAAPQLQRVRGTVESVSDTGITVKGTDGKSETVTLKPDTAFVSVVKSSLGDVGEGKFIGTATKGEPPVAIEVVIFPDAMKGTGEGHYAWDTINDTTGSGTAPVKSSMTNGTVKPKTAPLTKSAMTNGTIKKGTAAAGGKSITVTYDNGQSLDVTVPPSAPIVAFEAGDKAIVQPGTRLFAVTVVNGDKLEGKLVAIGKDGVVPPM